jgi:hypothetical protein
MGPDVPSLLDGPYKDVNPSCDLCRGYSLSYVPQFRSEQTVDTEGFGTQNCMGLYEAALNGNIFSSEACEEVRDAFQDCCSLPDLPTGESNQNMDDSENNGEDSLDVSSSATFQLNLSVVSLSANLLSILGLVVVSL